MRKALFLAAILSIVSPAFALLDDSGGSSSSGGSVAIGDVTELSNVSAYVITHTTVAIAANPGEGPITTTDYDLLSWTEDFDSLSEFNGSTFTATNSGRYEIDVYVTYDSGATFVLFDTWAWMAVKRNGSFVGANARNVYQVHNYASFAQSYVPPQTISLHAAYDLTAGDTLAVWFGAYDGNGSNVYIGNRDSVYETFLHIKRVE